MTRNRRIYRGRDISHAKIAKACTDTLLFRPFLVTHAVSSPRAIKNGELRHGSAAGRGEVVGMYARRADFRRDRGA